MQPKPLANVRLGSFASLCSCASDFRSTPTNGHRWTALACLFGADIVAKVFLGRRTKFFRAADAFYERRREGPYRFIQNRPGISVVR